MAKMTTRQLARRWSMNPATIRQWRWFNKGPQFQKIGGRILYKLEVIENFEDALIRAHTTADGKLPEEPISQLIAEESHTNQDK